MVDKDLSSSIIKSKRNIILFNSFLILLATLLCLCFVSTISTFKRLNNFMYDSKLLESDIADYFEAVINVLKGTKTNVIPNGLDENINLLNAYIVNPNGIITYKVFVVLIFITAIAMIILPLILLGLSINNIIKSKTSESYKKFFIWFLFLSLLMVLLINANDFGVGSGIISYIILTFIGVLLAIILQYIYLYNQKNTKNFILNLISFISLFVLFFLSMVSFSKIFIKLYIWNNSFNINFGSILANFEFLMDSEVIHTNYYVGLLENLKFREYISFNIQYVIPIFQVGAIALCLCTLMLQLKKILIKSKNLSCIYLWIGFVLFFLFTFAATIYVDILDVHIKQAQNVIEKVVINPMIYVVLALFLGINIYNCIIKKKINNDK